MKACLVYPDVSGVEQYGKHKFHHGLGYLSSVVKSAGHEVSAIYLDHDMAQEPFAARLTASAPDVVGFSATTHQYPYVTQFAQYAKSALPDVFVIVGGVHPTLKPDEVIEDPNIDAVCVGEGEYAMRDLLDRLEHGGEITDIQNLWVKIGGKVYKNPMRPLVDPLDSLPLADRDLFEEDEAGSTVAASRTADVIAGRGCPYSCTYCCNNVLRRLYSGLGRYHRFRSPENVVEEIVGLAKQRGVERINFQDDTFTQDHRYLEALCALYREKVGVPFWVNTRAEHVNEATVKTLKSAGCAGVRIGIETGNDWLRREVLKKRCTSHQIRDAFAIVRKHGMKTYACNMLGIPFETPEMVGETLRLNRQILPDEIQFSVFFPYPCTELADICESEGFLRDHTTPTSYYGSASVLNLPTLPQNEIDRYYRLFVELSEELACKSRGRKAYLVYRAARALLGSHAAARRVAGLATSRKGRGP